MRMNLGYNLRVPLCARVIKLGTVGILLALAVSGSLPAAQLSLQYAWTRYPDGSRYYDAWDARMADDYPSTNYGDDTKLAAEYHDGLGDSTVLQFLLPSLPHEGVTAATLSLYYYDHYGSWNQWAWLQIKPYRMITNWTEMGVTWKYRDKIAGWFWDYQNAGWNDKVDDADEIKQLKRQAGDPPPGIPVGNWVDFNVVNTVTWWDVGATNCGFGIYFNDSTNGVTRGAYFYSNQYDGDWSLHPKLAITYSGAQINWCGFSDNTWDSSAWNWNVGGLVGRDRKSVV
jgi:hypothetical protein